MAAYEQIKIRLRPIDRVLDSDKFRHLVDKYDGYRYVKHFTCWNQPLALMFGKLSNRKSLSDLVQRQGICIRVNDDSTLSVSLLVGKFEKTKFNDVKEQFGPLIPGLFD